MITVITRTSNRPRFFAHCRLSVLAQTVRPYHIVISDEPEDDYMEGDLVLRLPKQEGRGHNLYMNAARPHIPPSHPWVMFLDDDDRFEQSAAIETICNSIRSADDVLLWQVQFPHGLIPGGMIYLIPQMGNISGIGFCYHSKHWEDWQPIPCGDYYVINKLYRTLHPVWINAVLTGLQAAPGHGHRWDLEENNHELRFATS